MAEAFVYNIMGRGNDGSVDRVLDLPTNEAWIRPWVRHLRSLGVRFVMGQRAESLEVRQRHLHESVAADGQASEQVPIPEELREEEHAARFHMLEQLADHDDVLLEQLLMDEVPDRQTVFADLAKETGAAQIVPVLFGSAMMGFGVRRLLKTLRHEVPDPSAAAERLGASNGCAFVFKVSNSGAMGRLTYARLFGGEVATRESLLRRFLPYVEAQLAFGPRVPGTPLDNMVGLGLAAYYAVSLFL